MDLTEILTIIAILLGPIFSVVIALFLQRKFESDRRDREGKLWIFKTLMASRGARMSPEHVKALNMIDIEFREECDRNVKKAWKIYLNHLNSYPLPLGQINSESDIQRHQNWFNEAGQNLIELLEKMGHQLGYQFDKVDLEKNHYTPVAFGSYGDENQEIRQRLLELLSGKSHLPIVISTSPETDPFYNPPPQSPLR